VETSRHGLLNLFKPTVQRILTCTIHSTPCRVYCVCVKFMGQTERQRMNLRVNGGSINNIVFLLLGLTNYKSWPIYRQMTGRLWMVKYEISYFPKWTGENYFYLKLPIFKDDLKAQIKMHKLRAWSDLLSTTSPSVTMEYLHRYNKSMILRIYWPFVNR
jgi:hypothetical protein